MHTLVPGARLLPSSDDRCETHVVVDDPDTGDRRAIHFQEWWVRYRAQIPTHSFAFVGSEKATAGPGVVDAIIEADVVMLAPSNPVVSVGAILAVPGIRGARRSTSAPVVGYSPIIDGKPLRGMADAPGARSGCNPLQRRWASTTAHAHPPDSTAGWWPKATGPMSRGDREIGPVTDVRPASDAAMVRAGLELAGVSW